jgi:hypothetical protein
VAIARSNDGYVATLMGGRTTINNEPLEKRQALQDGDVLNVNGLVLEFRWKGRRRRIGCLDANSNFQRPTSNHFQSQPPTTTTWEWELGVAGVGC